MGGWRAWKRQAGVGDLTPQPPLHEWRGGAKFTLLKGNPSGEAGLGEAFPVWGRLSSLPVSAPSWERQAGVGDLTPQPPLHEWRVGAKFAHLKGNPSGEAGLGEAFPVWGRLPSLPVSARAWERQAGPKSADA